MDASGSNTSGRERLEPYSARVRFMKLRDRAIALFAEGHSYRAAWRVLSETDGLDISYEAFRLNAKALVPADALPEGLKRLAENSSDKTAGPPDDADQAVKRAPRSNPQRHRTRPPFNYDPANARREDLV